MKKKILALIIFATSAFSVDSSLAAGKPKLLVGSQEVAIPSIVEASGVFADLPYDVQWVVLNGPAAQLAALYSKTLDIGSIGDPGLIPEQGRAKTDWTEDNVPLQIIAGFKNPNPDFPPVVTVVRNSANINKPADLRGKKWAFNYGGYNYIQYLLSRASAGLSVSDFEPVQLNDAQSAGAAFNTGRVDAYSGSIGHIKVSLDRGDAHILQTNDDLGIPALSGFVARGDVIRDPERNKAVEDFLARMRKVWIWYDGHVDDVEKIYETKVKQTPTLAKFSAVSGKDIFVPLDNDFVAKEQKIADAFYASGDITKKVNVSVEFAQKYNAITAPQ